METKFVLFSRTVLGVIITLASIAADKFWGLGIDATLQGDLVDWIVTLNEVVLGPGLTLYGRLKASKKLTL